MKTKILYIIPSFRTGGAEVQLLTLLKGLDKSKYDVSVAVFYSGYALESQFLSLDGVRVVHLNKKGVLDFGFKKRLEKLFAEGFDIVQPINISARYYGLKLAHKFKVPVTVATERSARLLPTSFGSRIYLILEKFAMRRATVVVANSCAGQQFCISRGIPKEKTRVIYNGIDPERLLATTSREEMFERFQLPRDSLVIGTVGRLELQKDPFTFLSAAKLISEKVEKARFLLVGDGPLTMEAKAFSGQLGIKESCIFVGNQKNVADFYNMMDLFLLTSRTIEGCSNAILEAMHFGLPVIATNVGGNGEIVVSGSTGELVAPGEPEQLANLAIKFLTDQELLATFGQNARAEAEKKHSLSSLVNSYQELYAELLGAIEDRRV